MDDAAFDRVSRSGNRFLSRRAVLGTLAGGGLAALAGMGFAADAKRRKHRRRPKTCTAFRQPCASNRECCTNALTNCDVTPSSTEKVCCFPLGAFDCVTDADCCGANAVCRPHGCAEG